MVIINRSSGLEGSLAARDWPDCKKKKRSRKFEPGMLPEITHPVYFSSPPKGIKSTERGTEVGAKVEQNTHQHTLKGLARFKTLPFDPLWFLSPLPSCDIGQCSAERERQKCCWISAGENGQKWKRKRSERDELQKRKVIKFVKSL